MWSATALTAAYPGYMIGLPCSGSQPASRNAPKPWRRLTGFPAFVSGCILLCSCSTSSVPSATASTPVTPASRPPAARTHIMVLVMENQSYNQIIGNRSAPFINHLADRYLRATNSYARGHYSLPNYLEMISGRAYEASG